MKNKIVYDGRTFTATDIQSGNIHLAASLPSQKLEANTFTAVVKSDDTTLTEFARNTPLYYYHRDRLVCITYVQTVDRIGPDKYKFYGTSTIGRLIEQPHAGGIYTGQTAEEVISDICGSIPYEVKTVLRGIKLYGWLPYASPPKRSARDNLSQVLFAIGATVKTDLDGILRIESLWDGVSGTAGRDKMYTGASTDYDGVVTKVIVTEHQYIPGSEEKQLFEGTAQAGDIITFEEPMHSLVATGFSIQASGANWARVSAGSGTLTGKAYIHNTRQISRDVQQASTPNVKTVDGATLVSLVNSVAVAQRLAEYYKCRERMNASVVYRGETPGDRLSTYHPFDKIGVDACLESADITLSGTLKAQEKMLAGYIPPQPEDVEYFDHREVITQSGTWTAPEGVTEGVAVLIGGAWGGWSGLKGGETEKVAAVNYTKTLNVSGRVWTYKGYFASQGGAGGEPGVGGSGGRILVANFAVPSSGKISVQIGVGGAGGVFSPDASQPGTEGTPTKFGSLSSANGTPNAGGYVDTVTGEVFASTGPGGVAGGSGSGGPEQAPPDFTEDEDVVYVQGSTVTGPDGQAWTPDRLPSNANGSQDWVEKDAGTPLADSQLVCGACIGLSGGAAVGANGTNGQRGSVSAYLVNDNVLRGSCWCGDGGKGADAVASAKEPGNRGAGGRGGHGGGGAGGSGFAYSMQTGSVDKIYGYGELESAGPGNGSDGAPGGDGVLILYYRTPHQLRSGHLVTSDRKFFFDRLGRIFVV